MNCDGVVEEAMQLYWSKSKLQNGTDGHFIRRSNKVKSWLVSKSVDKVNKVKPSLPFMV